MVQGIDMKVVMVNDCAFVGETLRKYFPADIEVSHFKRTRGFLSKTFGIAWKIFRSKGDIYHVHYLLQDCYLTLKLKKAPIIGHAHGTDLRVTLKHGIWGKIVKRNLKYCNKVLVSTPDILKIAQKSNENAEYLPNAIDTGIFHLRPTKQKESAYKVVLLASGCNWKAKGTDKALRALAKFKDYFKIFMISYGRDFRKSLVLAKSLGLKLNILPKTSHRLMREYYWNADLVIGSIGAGSLGMVTLEAIACGIPSIAYVSSEYEEYNDFPLKDVNTIEEIRIAIEEASSELWKAEYDYINQHHSCKRVTERILKVYDTLAHR